MKFRDRLARFLSGRNGYDRLCRFLTWIGIGIMVLSLILSNVAGGLPSEILYGLALIIVIFSWYRMLSKNIYKRQAENEKFVRFAEKVKSWFRGKKRRIKDAKAYKYYRCPGCNSEMRVPRGKGKIRITCKKCGNVFEGRS